jgi:hypothetical protein
MSQHTYSRDNLPLCNARTKASRASRVLKKYVLKERVDTAPPPLTSGASQHRLPVFWLWIWWYGAARIIRAFRAPQGGGGGSHRQKNTQHDIINKHDDAMGVGGGGGGGRRKR